MNVRLGLRLFLLGLLLFTRLVNAADVPYSDNTSRALTWLQQQQQINGSFDNAQTQSTSWKASAEAAMAYSVSGNLDQINSGLLVQFMNAENSSSTEFLGLRVRINQTLNLDEANDIAEILSRQNDDGGFGSGSGFDSTVYDTVFALGALAIIGAAMFFMKVAITAVIDKVISAVGNGITVLGYITGACA